MSIKHLVYTRCYTKGFNVSTLLILTNTLRGRYSYFLHITHKITEAKKCSPLVRLTWPAHVAEAGCMPPSDSSIRLNHSLSIKTCNYQSKNSLTASEDFSKTKTKECILVPSDLIYLEIKIQIRYYSTK